MVTASQTVTLNKTETNSSCSS